MKGAAVEIVSECEYVCVCVCVCVSNLSILEVGLTGFADRLKWGLREIDDDSEALVQAN